MPDGTLLRQTKGIPMGNPLSPAMTIGACAWMEEEWMQQLDGDTKEKFVAKRYMDDILVAYAENQTWDHWRFCEDFEKSKKNQRNAEAGKRFSLIKGGQEPELMKFFIAE